MPTYLDAILTAHRAAAAARADGRDRARLEQLAADAAPARDFRGALVAGAVPTVIAEIKRRSPSKGDLNPDLDPTDLARQYEAGGAGCLSVLTDAQFFGGSPADLAAARAACELPVLRKDFTVCDADVVEARAMGADAVLLIVAALDDVELRRFLRLADEWGMAALVEVHDGSELDRAVAAGAEIIGVNQRNLRTFEVDRELAVALAAAMPDGAVKVAESGVRDAADVARLHAAGYDAVLVGETVVTAPHPGAAVKELMSECS